MLQVAGKKKLKRVVKFAQEDQVIPSTLEQHPTTTQGSLDETISNNLTHNFFSPKLPAPGSIRFRSREDRTRTAREAGINSTGGTVSNPDYADTLRRVSVVVQQHIIRGERVKRKYHQKLSAERAAAASASATSRSNRHTANSRYDSLGTPEMTVTFDPEGHVDLTGDLTGDRRGRTPSVQLSGATGETKTSYGERGSGPLEPRISLAAQLPVSERLRASSSFREDLFVKPTWKYSFIRPGAGSSLFLTNYRIDKVKKVYDLPEVKDIHEFIETLFVKGQVSLCRFYYI
jgi:hypothetical protein